MEFTEPGDGRRVGQLLEEFRKRCSVEGRAGFVEVFRLGTLQPIESDAILLPLGWLIGEHFVEVRFIDELILTQKGHVDSLNPVAPLQP